MKVELTTIELKALELKDINNFNDKKCASIMSISVKEYNDILNKARELGALIQNDSIYKELTAAREKTENDKVLQDKINEFKNICFKLKNVR